MIASFPFGAMFQVTGTAATQTSIVASAPPGGRTGRCGARPDETDPEKAERERADSRQRPRSPTTPDAERQLTSTSACIHGWMMHMK